MGSNLAYLDIDSLLHEIAPDFPCGENLEDDPAFMAVLEKAKGTPERHVAGQTIPEQPPNWKEVRRDLLKLLGKSRDLRLLVEMVRASLNIDGFAGLAESLELSRRALDLYWDTLHPQLTPEDGNDPSQRVNILSGLCNAGSMLRFIQAVPVVESRAFGRFSLRDIHISSGRLPVPQDGEAIDISAIKAAFADVAKNIPEMLRQTRAALQAGLDYTGQIEDFLTARVGTKQAPSLQPLRDKLGECLHVVEEQMAACGLDMEQKRESPDEVDAESEGNLAGKTGDIKAPPAPAVSPASPGRLAGSIGSRQDVILALDRICEYYDKFEPSSPIPLLLQRARRLVDKSFMEIIEDLAPDGLNQIQLIKGNSPEGN